MARLRIIILEREASSNTFSYVAWADVPAARQLFYVQPAGTVSAWKGATQADNDALVSGAVVERAATQRVPAGATLPQIEAFLEQRWSDWQTEITNANPWQRYGTTWDGTTWTVANNG